MKPITDDHRDPRVENWLQTFNLTYEVIDVPLDAVTIDSEAKQNIRMSDRVDEELVIRYGVALENGAKFPAIIVFRVLGKDAVLYGLINGWHRFETYKLADRTSIPAYVVQVTDKLLIQVLRRTANLLEGKPPTTAEMVEHAAWLAKQGYTITDAARLMNVHAKRLNDRILYDQVRERLTPLGIDTGELTLAPSAYPRLSSLRDPHLRRVVMLGHEARLSTERIHELARHLREAQSDAHADAILSEWERTYEEVIGRNKRGAVRDPASPLRKIPHMLNAVERALQVHRSKSAALSPSDMKRLITALRKTIGELEAMIQHLEEVSHAARA